MEREDELRKALAEEVRAAVAEASPAGAAPRSGDDPIRESLSRAARFLTPAVPRGVRLEGGKRLLLRLLRFLWRGQSSFNALSIAASEGMADSIERLRAEINRKAMEWDEARRRLVIDETRLNLLESGAARATGAAPSSSVAAAPGLPPGVYSLFEERFRGSPEAIAERQRDYLSYLRSLPGPVLDVGCGRGELLDLLAAEGIAASGIETNPVAVATCRSRGREVEEGDALALLSRRQGGRLGAVVAFQVVEHWNPAEIFRFLQEARRTLAPGGILLLETVNTDSISALRAFFLDPTHVRPVPPEALRFLAEAAGFEDARIELRSPLPDTDRLEERTENDRKLNALLYAPQDYALIARAPATP